MKKELSFFVKCAVVSTLIAILSGFCLLYAQTSPFDIETLGPFSWYVMPDVCPFVGGSEVGTTITIDGVDVQPGDIVAAFADRQFQFPWGDDPDTGTDETQPPPPPDDSVNDLCIGAIEIIEAGVLPALNAMGDDASSGETAIVKEGAEPNENVFFKIWDDSEKRLLYAVVTGNTKWASKTQRIIGLAAYSGISADVAGTKKDIFIGSDIYGAANLGLRAGSTYKVYVMADKSNWAEGDLLTGSPKTFVATSDGKMPAGTLLASTPANGGWDIIIDVDDNSAYGSGEYNVMVDYLDDLTQVGALVRDPIITASAGEGGTIDPSGAVSVTAGQNKAFKICPDSCHNILQVLVNGSPVTVVLDQDRCFTYTFENVTSDGTIEATFEIIEYTITASAGEHGSIDPSGAVSVDCGTSKEFTITPENCYEIGDVLVDGQSVLGQLVGNKYTFPNVTADHTIEASFVKMGPFTITPTAGANGTIDPSEPVTEIECDEDVSFTFTPADCHEIADVTVDGTTSVKDDVVDNGDGTFTYTFVDVKANHTIHVTFALKTYIIKASVDPEGPNGSITPSGDVSVDCGTDQQFVITANSCHHIDQVLVDGEPISLEAGNGESQISENGDVVSLTYTFEDVREPHTIEAKFAINEYTITASAGDNGSISPSGAVVVYCGSDQPFTMTPDDCYEIDKVLVDEEETSVTIDPGTGVGTYSFPGVTEDHTIHVTFKIKVYTIVATAGENGSIDPSGNVPVNCGDDKTFTMTPANVNFRIKQVLVNGSPVSITPGPDDTGTYTFENVRANATISVEFEPKERTITATAGEHGSISPSGEEGKVIVSYGTDQTFTITPDPCYKIADVLVDGVSKLADVIIDSAGVGTYTFENVIEDHTIHATFEIKVFTITASAGEHGSISPSGDIKVNCGSDQMFTITPADCYEIGTVLVDGVPVVVTTGTYSFPNVTKDHTISVTFKIKTYTIAATAGDHGSISPSGNVSVNCGASKTFTITPASCYEIDKVTVDGNPVSVTPDPELDYATYTFTNVRKNYTIHATFKIKVYTITATAGDHGSISPAGAVSVNCSTNKTFTITPATCYEIDDVLVNNVSKKSEVVINSAGVGTYTFTNVTASGTIHATFKIKVYTITASAGDNGSISPSGDVQVNCGSDVGFTITPAFCYEIDKVLVDGVATTVTINPTTGVGTYIFPNVTANHTISATFKKKVYTITVTSEPEIGGTVVPSGAVPVDCGTDKKFIVTASPCYHIDDILVDGESILDGNNGGSSVACSVITENGGNYTSAEVNFYSVMKDHTLKVVFAINVYTIVATAGDGGSIDPPGEVEVNCGSDKKFTITPDDCYEISDVLVDGSSVMPGLTVDENGKAEYTFTNVTADHTIHAVFAIKTYKITATAGSNGNIDPAGTIVVNCGSSKTFTMIPNTNYHVKSVVVDGVSVGAPSGYTFTDVKKDHTIHVTFEIDPISLLSACYDVPETLLTLRFDRPVYIAEPYVPCFSCIGMEVDDSGLMDFALSSNPDQNLKNRIWTDTGNAAIVHIDINRAYTTTINLAVAAFVSHKAEDINLLLSCDAAFTGLDGAKSIKADVPLPMIVDGYILGMKGDVTGNGKLETLDPANILKASVVGMEALPIHKPGKKVDGILAGFGYAKCDTPLYIADWTEDGKVNAGDAQELLHYLAGIKVSAPASAIGPKVAKLSVNECRNGKLDVSVDLDNASGVYSADIVVAYDPGVLTVSEVARAFATSGWLFEEATEPGKVRIAMAGLEQPSENGALVDMSFDTSSADVIGKIDILDLKLNGGSLRATIENLPKKFALLQNYPNPFNPETWIPYQLVESSEVNITIYNANGQVVRRLELGNRMPGNYTNKVEAAYWDGCNESGERVSSGIYFYQLQAGRDSSVRKMIVVK